LRNLSREEDLISFLYLNNNKCKRNEVEQNQVLKIKLRFCNTEEKMKRIVVTLVLVVGIVAVLSAWDGMRQNKGNQQHDCQGLMQEQCGMHQGMSHGMHQGMGEGFGFMLGELELTDAQMEEIENLQMQHHKDMIQFKAEIDIMQVDKQAAMRDHDFGKVKKLTGKIFDLKKNQAVKQVEHQEAVWNVLTPEQQAKADQLKKDRPHFKMMQHQRMMDDELLPGMKMRKQKFQDEE
jgi:Spy/CpxP family protein refolding chaperone